MRKCPFCDKYVGNDPHIYFCKNKTTDEKKEIKFLFLLKNFPILSNKENLMKIYQEDMQSLVDIKKSFGIDFKSVLFLLEYFNIKKRSISESSKVISTKKYKKTCMSKYGVDNISKRKDIKEKKKKTFIKNYGVDNIFKDIEFKNWIMKNNFAWNNLTDEENRDRINKQKISIKKYWNNLTDDQKNKFYNYNGTSNLESKIAETLSMMSISFSTQFLLKGKLFDFKILNTNILIEVNGDYWHCNPLKYKIDQVVKFPGFTKSVSDIWKKDEIKRNLAEKAGFKVIYIWEDEIKKSNNLFKLINEKIIL